MSFTHEQNTLFLGSEAVHKVLEEYIEPKT